ncbi:hypothetical protein Cni_G24481 [Canna indica]|uniref:1-acyl-sn-glycerol-3-phosphate acyltransferase n=1 Tax=Canna indica TaxID=4628 RepID=A0AAQ3KW14_9LILI|nr:hypothetical protein Cni_G24481 [Canna indica]
MVDPSLLTSLLQGSRLESCLDAAIRLPERKEEAEDDAGVFVDDDRWVTVAVSVVRIVACFITMMFTTFVWAVVMIVMLPWPYERIRQGNLYGHVTGRLMMWILGNPIKIEGSEFSDTRAIFICNHASPIDIFLAMWLTPVGTVGIAKKEIIWYPLFGQLYLLANHLRIDRSNPTAAIESLKEAATAIMNNNLSLIFFPEGTRSRSGRLLPFKKGFLHIALQTRLPIVPMILTGTHLAWRKNSLRVRPAPIAVKYLPPIATDGWKEENMNEYIDKMHSLTFYESNGPYQRSQIKSSSTESNAGDSEANASCTKNSQRSQSRTQREEEGEERREGKTYNAKREESAVRNTDEMAPKKGGEELTKGISKGSALSEALLYATMCFVGLPVEVQVKDGSLYSGILHTACFDSDHGIVLKKARKIGKGKSRTNLALGDFVDTLVVLSSDLVQVIVKGFTLPTGGTVGRVAGKTAEAENGSQTCSADIERGESESTPENFIVTRQATGCRAEDKKLDDPIEEVVHEVHRSVSSNANGATCSSPASLHAQLVSPESEAPASMISPLPDSKTSVCSTSTALASDTPASPLPGRSASSDTAVPKRNKTGSISAKESKLNPSAKVFTPSIANLRQIPTPVPRFVSPSQMSNNLPVMPISGAQLGTEVNSLASRLTVPSKLIPYNNVIAAQAGMGTQYARPVMGHTSVRQLPVRMNGQYHPLQAGHLYLSPHSQMVAVGPLHQPSYVHPVTQDVIQGTLMPQAQPHPLFMQANALKFQGAAAQTLQLPMTPPIMAVENQTLMAPTHVPFSQPFPVAQPIMIPGGNGYILH